MVNCIHKEIDQVHFNYTFWFLKRKVNYTQNIVSQSIIKNCYYMPYGVGLV